MLMIGHEVSTCFHFDVLESSAWFYQAGFHSKCVSELAEIVTDRISLKSEDEQNSWITSISHVQFKAESFEEWFLMACFSPAKDAGGLCPVVSPRFRVQNREVGQIKIRSLPNSDCHG